MKKEAKKRQAHCRIGILIVLLILCMLTTMDIMSVRTARAAGDEAKAETKTEAALPPDIHAKAAVLMDGDSGRVLFGKNMDEVLPMASTTKVMSLIVALEHAALDEVVTVSAYAAGMPDVQLGIREGEQYVLKDLLYSMMLESHNDVAVAIAEHVGGSVEGFAKLMNEKAAALGCVNTYFITPNGLDAADAKGIHATTAKELGRIMSYAITNETFLEITRTAAHSFCDVSQRRSFSVNNKNALLTMTEDALSGKTGFTGDAGYCYVGAVENEGRTFVVALLGCGWPPNKSWKWKDTAALMDFGKEHFKIKTVGMENVAFEPVRVTAGTKARVFLSCESKKVKILLGDHETFKIRKRLLNQTQAPIENGDRAGCVEYMVDDQVIYRYPVVFKEAVGITDFKYYANKVLKAWCGF